MSFKSLGLNAELLLAIQEEGYQEPTPIQRQAIPLILKRQDVLAAAQTGTGKTAGFTLPLLQLLSASDRSSRKHCPVRALILVPTRELAAQVADSVKTYGRHLSLTSAVIFGGVNINPQIAQLRKGVDILIATPGRLLDLINQGATHLNQIEILVLDEADRMLDMGFIHDIRRVLGLLPKERQNLLFSATFSREIKALANGFLHKPALIEVAPPNATATGIAQVVHIVEQSKKRELLSYMIGSKNWQQVLVFTRTKHGANRLVEQLQLDGLTAAAIHGNKSQGARTKALADFKEGRIRVLVATDIAARGLDIDGLPHVINYELPNVPEDYVHRIGRTGRAKNKGVAISLVGSHEFPYLKDIEKLLKQKIPQQVIPGYESEATYTHEPMGKSQPNAQRFGKSGSGNKRTSSHATKTHSGRKPSQTNKRGQGHNEKREKANKERSFSDRKSASPSREANGNRGYREVPSNRWSSENRSASEKRRPSKGRDEQASRSSRGGNNHSVATRKSRTKNESLAGKRWFDEERKSSASNSKKHRSGERNRLHEDTTFASHKRNTSNKTSGSNKHHSSRGQDSNRLGYAKSSKRKNDR